MLTSVYLEAGKTGVEDIEEPSDGWALAPHCSEALRRRLVPKVSS